jgi:hypothetical protein
MGLARLLLAGCLCVAPVFAERGDIDLRGTFGFTSFIDDGPQGHKYAGASLRYYLSSRFSVEPEFVFLYRDRTDRDTGFLVNVAWDFRDPSKRVVPYAIGGMGSLSTFRRLELANALCCVSFNSTDWMFSGGFGAKIYFKGNWFVAPDVRLGWEPIGRITGSVGYSWR